MKKEVMLGLFFHFQKLFILIINLKMNIVNEAIKILRGGGVIASPTDTVYGLLADATNPDAVKKVYRIKGREEGKALPVFLYSLDWVDRFALVNDEQRKFLQNIWPGKVTVVVKLRKNHTLAPNVVSKEETIALRIPNQTLILELLANYKKPLTGTSANISGMPPCLDAKCVKRQLTKTVPDLIIDWGNLPPSEASTIIDLTKSPWRITRKGAGYENVCAWIEGKQK